MSVRITLLLGHWAVASGDHQQLSIIFQAIIKEQLQETQGMCEYAVYVQGEMLHSIQSNSGYLKLSNVSGSLSGGAGLGIIEKFVLQLEAADGPLVLQ